MSQYIISIKQCAEYMQMQTRVLSIADDQNPSRLSFLSHPLQHFFSKGFLMTDALEEHDEKISKGDITGVTITFIRCLYRVTGVSIGQGVLIMTISWTSLSNLGPRSRWQW